MSQSTSAPVTFEIDYPERLSRLHLLLKSFFGWFYVFIPHGIILYIYGLLSAVATLISFFAILFTGRYPQGLFDFVVGYQRWSARFNAYIIYYMVDSYPPFSNASGSHPVQLEIDYPDTLSRGKAVLKVLLGWLYVGIPHGVCLLFYGVAVLVLVFLAWWSVLILGRYPRAFFDFNLGFFRWSARVNAYLALLRDEYPPFSGRA